ncbi:hypothetical protein GCM10012287_57240 [Streptomyces daqingensis]|uniref:Uncharacterized protein n=1 Tax=Streptomyces daqingensis TaxID=1472640 RepID=A0ABQ2MZ31_9ACTN|nr:hypothetical protein GCM10012287_57240 [Streptomyces daqingensis]
MGVPLKRPLIRYAPQESIVRIRKEVERIHPSIGEVYVEMKRQRKKDILIWDGVNLE